MRVSACVGGPRTRDHALAAAGEPVLSAVPGYTLGSDMSTARLFITIPEGLSVTGAISSNTDILNVSCGTSIGSTAVVHVHPFTRGRARVSVQMSDGTSAVAHYLVLPPFTQQVESVAKHWSEVAWLPRDYPDPFGRGASVLPWDREDKRHRLNDGRAYDVGLSDDAGAAQNLGLASSQACAPSQTAVDSLDEYVSATLYGIKNDTAQAPFKSLQQLEPGNGVRMTLFYYNQTHFPYNYTEQVECGVVGGLNYNWCMTERLADAVYRGFNYPHQIMTYYSLYRIARNHPLMKVKQSWQWYLARAANTTLRCAARLIDGSESVLICVRAGWDLPG